MHLSQNINLDKLFDLISYNVMGHDAKYFPHCIENVVKLEIPLFYPSWEEVPPKEKVKVIQSVEVVI